MSERCAACGQEMVPGPPREWTGQRGDYSVSARNLPILVCPGGCPGFRVSTGDVLKDIFAISRSMSMQLAKRKGLFSARLVCRNCGGELTPGDPRHEFTFTGPFGRGLPIQVVVSGPCLDCIACGLHHLPPPDGREGIDDLTGTIAEALTQDGGTP